MNAEAFTRRSTLCAPQRNAASTALKALLLTIDSNLKRPIHIVIARSACDEAIQLFLVALDGIVVERVIGPAIG